MELSLFQQVLRRSGHYEFDNKQMLQAYLSKEIEEKH